MVLVSMVNINISDHIWSLKTGPNWLCLLFLLLHQKIILKIAVVQCFLTILPVYRAKTFLPSLLCLRLLNFQNKNLASYKGTRFKPYIKSLEFTFKAQHTCLSSAQEYG